VHERTNGFLRDNRRKIFRFFGNRIIRDKREAKIDKNTIKKINSFK